MKLSDGMVYFLFRHISKTFRAVGTAFIQGADGMDEDMTNDIGSPPPGQNFGPSRDPGPPPGPPPDGPPE